MGLPLFKTPADGGISPRLGDNKDTSNERTSIRRRGTIRGSDLRARAHQIQARIRQARVQVEGLIPSEEPSQGSQEAEHEEYDASFARFVEERRRRARMDGAPIAHPSPWADLQTPPPLPLSTRGESAPRVQTSNPWDWDSQPDGPVMPPAPESSDFAWAQGRSRQYAERRAILQRLYQERFMNPRLAGTSTNSRGSNSAIQTSTTSHAIARWPVPESTARLSWSDNPFGYQQRNTDLETSALSSLGDDPATRRRFRVPRVDGLGDRDRSLSPEDDGAWETLLTTISPDPQPPSAGSSFASTSASAAASASSNARSSATSMATTMTGANDTTFETVCEYVETHSPASETEEEEGDLYELDDSRLAGERFWRGYADVVAARADRVARHSGHHDGDALGGMQRIVQRLARREDIPDEWWAEAGLSRTLPRELVR